jgi:hypothetical protein
MWISGGKTLLRLKKVEIQLALCLRRIRRINNRILEAKTLGHRIQELKYLRMLKSTVAHYEELKAMKYYLITT